VKRIVFRVEHNHAVLSIRGIFVEEDRRDQVRDSRSEAAAACASVSDEVWSCIPNGDSDDGASRGESAIAAPR